MAGDKIDRFDQKTYRLDGPWFIRQAVTVAECEMGFTYSTRPRKTERLLRIRHGEAQAVYSAHACLVGKCNKGAVIGTEAGCRVEREFETRMDEAFSGRSQRLVQRLTLPARRSEARRADMQQLG